MGSDHALFYFHLMKMKKKVPYRIF